MDGLFDPPIEYAVAHGVLLTGWRLAKSLAVLRQQVNELAPNRSRALDGTIGDSAHAARASRHNPYQGVVTALDLTHDPAGGLDAHALARRLTADPHPNLYYVISNREAAYRKEGFVWRRYGGSHPHDRHIHVAVGYGPDAAPFTSLDQVDNQTPWPIGEEVDMTDQQYRDLMMLARLNRVSAVARSFDLDINIAHQDGDAAREARLREHVL